MQPSQEIISPSSSWRLGSSIDQINTETLKQGWDLGLGLTAKAWGPVFEIGKVLLIGDFGSKGGNQCEVWVVWRQVQHSQDTNYSRQKEYFWDSCRFGAEKSCQQDLLSLWSSQRKLFLENFNSIKARQESQNLFHSKSPDWTPLEKRICTRASTARIHTTKLPKTSHKFLGLSPFRFLFNARLTCLGY